MHFVLNTSFDFAQQRKWLGLAAKLREQIQDYDVAGTGLLQAPFQTYVLLSSLGGMVDIHFNSSLKKWPTNADPISACIEMLHSFLLAVRTVFPRHL